MSASILRDATFILPKLPWQLSFVFTLICFLIFYFLIPAIFDYYPAFEVNTAVSSSIDNFMRGKGVWIFQKIGMGIGIIGLFFTALNYFYQVDLTENQNWVIRFIAKLIGRNID